MSSRIFQNVIIQMKDSVDRTIGVVDEQGFVVASSELAMIGSRLDDFRIYEFEGADNMVSTASRTYKPLASNNSKFDYAAFVDGNDAVAKTICAVSAVASNPDFSFVEFSAENGFECDPAESSISVGIRKNSDLTAEVNKALATLTATEKEAMMDAAIARQPAEG